MDIISRFEMKIDNLGKLIETVHTSVNHSIDSMWALMGIGLAVIAITGFFWLQSLVEKRIEKNFESHRPFISNELDMMVTSAKRVEYFTPTLLNGSKSSGRADFQYGKINENNVILSGNIQALNHSMIFTLPMGYRPINTIYIRIPALRVNDNYLYEAFVEINDKGFVSPISGTSGINGESILYFNNIILRVS